MRDLISRQAAVDAVNKICDRCGEHKKYDGVMCGTCYLDGVTDIIEDLPSAQPEVKAISYQDCQNALLKMWMDNVVTNGEYRRMVDKLNAIQEEKDG